MADQSRKKNARREKYADYLKKLDSFEQRYSTEGNYYYLFNPFTGETLNQTGDFYDRAMSTWAPAEKPSKLVDYIELFPVFYASRTWGRRKCKPFETIDAAATHIAAVMRGLLERRALQRYFASRYVKVLDKWSGYYYFVDNYALGDRTSWYKPRLAFPTDIPVFDPLANDPQEFLKGDKYTYREFTKGPYLRLAGIGKLQTARAKHGK